MRLQTKHLLLLTTAWAVLFASTYLHAGVAKVLSIGGTTLLTLLIPMAFIAFVVGAVTQRSLRGGMSRTFGRLLYATLAVWIVVVVSIIMSAWHRAH